MSKPISRYPGIPPFTIEHKEVFFGRDMDKERLYNLVLTENLVLLQSKSGMGKSSLINAGLISLLRKNNDAVVHCFRFNNYIDEETSKSPLENMVNTLDDKNNTVSFLNSIIPNENSLWYHYKTKQITADRHLTFYLIFDQFEELFTYPDEFVFAFKKQMSDLIYNTIPKNFQIVLNRKQTNNDKDLPTNQEIRQLYTNLDVHVLFAIRSDRMGELDKLSDYIPTIFRTRFELVPLTYEQIKSAIAEPARKDGNYISPKFEFQDEVVDEIRQYLTKQRSISADTTLLQIICQKLEKMVPKGSEPGKFVIEKSHLPEFEDIVMEFYTDTINLIDTDERVKTQKFIEDELIKGNQRISFDKLVCLEHISEKALDILLKNHLLRTEKNSTGGISYELAHDKLVPSIKESAEKRRKREADEFSEAQRQEELRLAKENAENERREREKETKRQAELLTLQQARAAEAESARQLAEENYKNQKKAVKKQKRLMWLAIIAAIVAVCIANYAITLEKKANDALSRAELMQKKVETAVVDKAIREHFNEWKGFANYFWDETLYSDTKEGIEILNKIDSIDLRANALLRIPEDVTRCPNLAHINLLDNPDIDWKASENTLLKLSDRVGIYVSLFDLSEVNSNQLHFINGVSIYGSNSGVIPQNIIQHTQLKYLDLLFYQSNVLPPEIGNLSNLTELGLSYNKLIVLPPEIGKLAKLTRFDLSDNNLLAIPPEIGKLSNLTELDLSYNKLVVLPPEIGKLSNLTYLDLSSNQLTSLPPEIGKLSNLTGLNLSNNGLNALPPEILKLTNLNLLNLSSNQLSVLPPEIGKITNLTELDLSGNKLSVIPEEIGKLKSLTRLDLSYNKLAVLSKEIQKLTNLTVLSISHIQLSVLLPEIGKFTKLAELDLSGNELSVLPKEIGKLTNLTRLDLSFNKFGVLPPEIGNLTNLTELDLSDNQLSVLPPEFLTLKNLIILNLSYIRLKTLMPEIGKFTNLAELDLSDNLLTSLPPEIGNLTDLTRLDLSDNKLGVLPPEIGKLSNLTELDLSSNLLTSLPPEFMNLINLTKISLSKTELTKLPSEISGLQKLTALDLSLNKLSDLQAENLNLTNLTTLDLSENELSDLPKEIGKLTNLRHLYLSKNRLSSLPPEILKLANLTELDLSRNELSVIPKKIWRLKNLTTLDLSGNKLCVLPKEIGKLTNLTNLYLYGNQFKSIPNEIFTLKISSSSLQRIGQMLFEEKNYEQAYLIEKKLISIEPDNNNNWFTLSFYCLFVEKIAEGIQAAQKSLELAPEDKRVITNLALGYLLNNQYDKAEPLYREWKDRQFPDDDRFAKDIFLKDINDLEDAKITHPDFEKVRKLLNE